jgi:hypothetical protein
MNNISPDPIFPDRKIKTIFISMQLYLIILSVILISCSSHRKIDKPNFELRQEAARQEIDRFALWSKPYLSVHSDFEFGPKAKRIAYAEAAPLIREVSPRSKTYLDRYEKWQMRKWLALTFSGVSYLLGSMNPNEVQKKQMQIFAVISGSYGLGIHFYQIHQLRQVPPRFNKDLNEKFFPTLNWSSSF